MIQAMSVAEIEQRVVERHEGPRSILLVMSSHDPNDASSNHEFLAKVMEFHFHSGPLLDCFCCGYSAYEPEPNAKYGSAVRLPKGTAGFLMHYYPEVFNEIRLHLVKSLGGRWTYTGGTDLLLFSADGNADCPVTWERAAILQSRRCIGTIFQDVEEMFRTVINLNEREGGNLVPNQLEPEMNKRRFAASLRRFADSAGPDLLNAMIGLF